MDKNLYRYTPTWYLGLVGWLVLLTCALAPQAVAQTMDSHGNYVFTTTRGDTVIAYMFDLELRKTGTWQWRTSEGVLLQTAEFNQGRLDGELIRYHHGKPVCKEVFRNDTLQMSQEFLPSGSIIGQARYGQPLPGNNRVMALDGQFVWINKRTPSNQPCACRFYMADTTGNIVVRNRGVDGTRYVVQYVNNQPEGMAVLWYSVGKKKSETPYTQGKREGTMLVYYPTGKIQFKVDYSNNLRHGTFVWYHDNGKVYVSGQFANDKKTGQWKQFTETGKATPLTEKPWLMEW